MCRCDFITRKLLVMECSNFDVIMDPVFTRPVFSQIAAVSKRGLELNVRFVTQMYIQYMLLLIH